MAFSVPGHLGPWSRPSSPRAWRRRPWPSPTRLQLTRSGEPHPQPLRSRAPACRQQAVPVVAGSHRLKPAPVQPRGPLRRAVPCRRCLPWLPCHIHEYEESKEDDDANYRIAIGSFIPRRLIVLALFQFVPVALVSYHGDLRSSAISFHVTCF